MRFSVCIDAVYGGLAPAQAIEQSAAVGAQAIEFWQWWDKDLPAIKNALEETGLTLAGFCTRSFNLTDPNLRSEFLEGLEQSLETAQSMNCHHLITQSGPRLASLSREKQLDSLMAGLSASRSLLEKYDVTLLLEPLNTFRDHPDILLSDSAESFAIIRTINHPQIKLLFDIYHQQISCGNILATVLPNIDLIAHFHAASVPGRQQLTLGELHYGRIFQAIDATDYQGHMGLEYWPDGDASESLRQCIALAKPKING